MKTMISIFTMFMIGAASAAPKRSVKTAFRKYINAGDTRDVTKLDEVLHKDYQLLFTMKGTKKFFSGNKASYISMAKAGKIGGEKRRVKFLGIERFDHYAIVRAKVYGQKLSFKGVYTFVNTEDGWRLIRDAVLATKI